MDGGVILSGGEGERFTGDPISLEPGAVTVSARLFGDDGWSALTEAEFVVSTPGAAEGNLVISELHYHPEGGRDAEFVEFLITGSEPVNLDGVRFSDGIEFAFEGARVLAVGQRVVIVSNREVFLDVYGNRVANVEIAGEFERRLSNGGEKLVLLARDGSTIFDVTYDDTDPWPAAADGSGASLVFNGGDPNTATNWSASAQSGGTPGNAPIAADGFNAWMTANGFTDPLASFGDDGRSNLVAYFTGADLASAPADVLNISADGSLQMLRRSGLSGVSGKLEVSTDLEAWTTIAVDALEVTEQLPDGREVLRAVIGEQGAPAVYVRLVVVVQR